VCECSCVREEEERERGAVSNENTKFIAPKLNDHNFAKKYRIFKTHVFGSKPPVLG